ncbi:MAG: primosomal protein N', partial [Planctomycetes bacterium]|nr:primosomal protein N' [Planctomycetota bacterium]
MVEHAFPGRRVLRVDAARDRQQDMHAELASFMQGEGDILVGTQIVSKGLDSPNILFTAALNADQHLQMPDFRAAEREFQLITQLAGRSGRGGDAGCCVIQTEEPEHYMIRHAIHHDYVSFFKEEALYRQQFGYPPFTRLARFIFSAIDEEDLRIRLK